VLKNSTKPMMLFLWSCLKDSGEEFELRVWRSSRGPGVASESGARLKIEVFLRFSYFSREKV